MSHCDSGRGMTPAKEKFWKEINNKNEQTRLKWFTKNLEQLKEIAEQETVRKSISPEILAEVERMKVERYRNIERHGGNKEQIMQFPDIDPHCILNVMKPVPEKVRKLLYTNTEKLGTKTYLNARYVEKPEDRYYYPETMNFTYGWKISAAQKALADEPRYGNKQVIKESFYRRNGALTEDPFFYRTPL